MEQRHSRSAPRVAVITGAAQGIGRTVARVLAQRGFALGLNDLRSPAETLDDVRGTTELLELVGDITDENVVTDFGERVKSNWGRVDVLVSNAGISSILPAENTSAAQFRRVLDVNLVAAFVLAKVFGSMMLAQRSGSIINIASIAGLVGIADRAAYNASKHGVVGLTRTLAAEWGGAGYVATPYVRAG
jgi:NAD(P)-dependent dehydrogenase (short-subunit alcohol dehydrogenase family)